MQLTRTLADRDTLVLFLINHLPPGALAASHTLCRADGGGVGAVGRAGRSTAGEELTFNRTLCNVVDKERSSHPHCKQTGSEVCVRLSARVANLYSVTTMAVMYIQLVWNWEGSCLRHPPLFDDLRSLSKMDSKTWNFISFQKCAYSFIVDFIISC